MCKRFALGSLLSGWYKPKTCMNNFLAIILHLQTIILAIREDVHGRERTFNAMGVSTMGDIDL